MMGTGAEFEIGISKSKPDEWAEQVCSVTFLSTARATQTDKYLVL
jgi:hypothetical protein